MERFDGGDYESATVSTVKRGDVLDHPGLADTRFGEWYGVVEEVIKEQEKDAEWDAYLSREWAERNMEYGFRCDFALKALHMHGPCYVYRPDEDGELVLAEVIDPVTRKALTGPK